MVHERELACEYMKVFQFHPLRNSGFKHGSVIVNNIFAYFYIVVEYIPGIRGSRKDVGSLPNQLLCSVLSTSD